MHSSSLSLFVRRGQEGLALALLLATSVFGCFRDPNVDVTQPRHCRDNKSCPYGYVCGPDGFCCASSDGTTCTVPPVSTGGAGAQQVDGSSDNDAPADLPYGEARAGTGGTGGFPEAGTGGAAGSGGALDGRGLGGGAGGVDRDGGPDSPLGGAGGGLGGAVSGGTLGGGGISGSGGMTGPGGTGGAGGLAPTGGTRASGGVTGIGATGGGGTGSGGTGRGGTGSGGAGSGGQTGCGGSQKPCNGGCIPISECCGGCSGDTPVCNNGTCEGRPDGSACTTATAAQCTSGVCADGVCCNETCNGVCEACNLTSSRGTCSPTTTPRSGLSCTTDGSTCGGSCDGAEAHRKVCYYPATQCAAQKCESGTQTYSKTCDGAGRCAAPTPATKSCSPYACADSVSCATDCPPGQDACGGTCVAINTADHCGSCTNVCTGTAKPICSGGTTCVECTPTAGCSSSKPVCSNNVCVQCTSTDDSACSGSTPDCKTSTNTCVQCTSSATCAENWPSEPICYTTNNTCVECTSSSQCAAAYGPGSTCNTSSHRCQCRQPTKPGNLLTNPGFETDLSGWAPFSCALCPSPLQDWQAGPAFDADGCPSSGSVHVTYYTLAFGSVTQCVPATANTVYRVGFRYRQQSTDPDAIQCLVNYYSGTTGGSCSGDSIGGIVIKSGPVPAAGTWGSKADTFTTEPGTNSIRIECGSNSLYDGWIDQIYLATQASGVYY